MYTTKTDTQVDSYSHTEKSAFPSCLSQGSEGSANSTLDSPSHKHGQIGKRLSQIISDDEYHGIHLMMNTTQSKAEWYH